MNFWKRMNSKEYPDFWITYLSFFKTKAKKQTISDSRFIAFDTETTGFDDKSDRILSIGAVAIKNGAIDVSDQLEIYLEQTIFTATTVKIHGIRRNLNLEKKSEKKALQEFLEFIENSILIAHHASFDRKMINAALQRQGLGTLKNRFLDTGVLFRKTKHTVYISGNASKSYSLDELGNDLKIPMSDRHTASGDAFITALAFLKIMAKLKIPKTDTVRELFR